MMLALPLGPADDRADPLFEDTESRAQRLKQLQLTNLQFEHIRHKHTLIG